MNAPPFPLIGDNPDALRPGIVGMRGSMVFCAITTMHGMSSPPRPPAEEPFPWLVDPCTDGIMTVDAGPPLLRFCCAIATTTMKRAAAGDLKRRVRKALERGFHFEERLIWSYFSQVCKRLVWLLPVQAKT